MAAPIGTAVVGVRPGRRAPTAVAAVVLAAGLIQGDALATSSGAAPFQLAGLATAVPVAVLLAIWARYRRPGAMLGTLGLVVFSTLLLATTRWPGSPQPLVVAEGLVLFVGAVLAALRHVPPSATIDGLVLTYGSAAVIFEGTALLLGRL